MITIYLLETQKKVKYLNQLSINPCLSRKLAAIMKKIKKVRVINMKVINKKITIMLMLLTILKSQKVFINNQLKNSKTRFKMLFLWISQ